MDLFFMFFSWESAEINQHECHMENEFQNEWMNNMLKAWQFVYTTLYRDSWKCQWVFEFILGLTIVFATLRKWCLFQLKGWIWKLWNFQLVQDWKAGQKIRIRSGIGISSMDNDHGTCHVSVHDLHSSIVDAGFAWTLNRTLFTLRWNCTCALCILLWTKKKSLTRFFLKQSYFQDELAMGLVWLAFVSGSAHRQRQCNLS